MNCEGVPHAWGSVVDSANCEVPQACLSGVFEVRDSATKRGTRGIRYRATAKSTEEGHAANLVM